MSADREVESKEATARMNSRALQITAWLIMHVRESCQLRAQQQPARAPSAEERWILEGHRWNRQVGWKGRMVQSPPPITSTLFYFHSPSGLTFTRCMSSAYLCMCSHSLHPPLSSPPLPVSSLLFCLHRSGVQQRLGHYRFGLFSQWFSHNK